MYNICSLFPNIIFTTVLKYRKVCRNDEPYIYKHLRNDTFLDGTFLTPFY